MTTRGRLMVRLALALIVSLLAAWIGVVQWSAASATPAERHAAYTYDSHLRPALVTPAASERGPPAMNARDGKQDSVERWSHGASARPGSTLHVPTTTYTSPTTRAQLAGATTRTGSQIVVADGDLSSRSPIRVAAKSGVKALPSGPKITAQWSADTYRHGGLMSTIEHINYRHAYNSGFADVSRFAQGTSARDIKGLVDQALRTGSVTGRGIIGNIGRTIGTDIDGNAVAGLEVIVRNGMIKTAYPVGIP